MSEPSDPSRLPPVDPSALAGGANDPAPRVVDDGRTHPLRPVPAVGVVVWWGLQVLLVRRRNAPQAGQWSVPGGLQELGETVFEAARREVEEETSMQVEPTRIVTVMDHIERDIHREVVHHFVICQVAATCAGGEPQPSDDVSEARWASIEEAESLIINDTLKRVLRQALAQRL